MPRRLRVGAREPKLTDSCKIWHGNPCTCGGRFAGVNDLLIQKGMISSRRRRHILEGCKFPQIGPTGRQCCAWWAAICLPVLLKHSVVFPESVQCVRFFWWRNLHLVKDLAFASDSEQTSRQKSAFWRMPVVPSLHSGYKTVVCGRYISLCWVHFFDACCLHGKVMQLFLSCRFTDRQQNFGICIVCSDMM